MFTSPFLISSAIYLLLEGISLKFMFSKNFRKLIKSENYRNLLGRISGYNAYFGELNEDMQMELIKRQQLKI